MLFACFITSYNIACPSIVQAVADADADLESDVSPTFIGVGHDKLGPYSPISSPQSPEQEFCLKREDGSPSARRTLSGLADMFLRRICEGFANV